jgi:ferredoxin
MGNVVYYFSGTGNSLKAAKVILQELGGGELVCMAAEGYAPAEKYDTIGFVYPAYFWGVPNAVRRFVSSLDLSGQQGAYIYALATFGGGAPGSVTILNKLLKQKGARLDYGRGLQMFSNYVIMYDMKTDVEQITKRSDNGLDEIARAIKGRETNRVGAADPMSVMVNKNFSKKAPTQDRHYSVGAECTGCGVCAKVCPVGNIKLTDGRPRFAHRCEQCVACIQYCPTRAINYKNATRGRGRYTNPDISAEELARCNRAAVRV